MINISKVSNVYTAHTVSSPNKINKQVDKKIEGTYTPSETANDFATILNAIRASDGVRADKVNAIKASIEAGTYSVSSHDIASKILT
ncbi:MAG: flagellar biosynthesis anti-sigma factor FlgM [Defluviitaleaceae bacterium]|nr:flagellar biosynthesis anti-sigma factor FlgM [Defluviitaleaceae bacterium]